MPDLVIAIVDDDEAVRLSTEQLLRRAGYGIRTFGSGDEFLAGRGADDAACILLDMRMPGSDGLAVLKALAEQDGAPPVIVITGHGDIALAVTAMKLGAQGFMEKPYAPADLMSAIEAALANLSTRQDMRALRRAAAARVAALSVRQVQVLRGILDGQPNKIIAYSLSLSIRTIESYRAQMLAKLGVRGTAEAVQIALAAGLERP